MSEPFIGEIKAVGFQFAPRNWANCNGTLIGISQNQTLFALLGSTYGGDGRTSFALPDLRGRTAIGTGRGIGSSFNFRQGQKAGSESITLSVNNLPAHSHRLMANNAPGNSDSPESSFLAAGGSAAFSGEVAAGIPVTGKAGAGPSAKDLVDTKTSGTGQVTGTVQTQPYTSESAASALHPASIGSTGQSSPVANMQPCLALNYIIALQGVFPSRN